MQRQLLMGLLLAATAVPSCGPQASMPTERGEGTETETETETTLAPTVTASPPTTDATADGTATSDATTMSAESTSNAPDLGVDLEDCDLLAQDCPAGYKCAPALDDEVGWIGTHCVPVADDPVAPGEPCTSEGPALTGLDDCDVGGLCWQIDSETSMGTCVRVCSGPADDLHCEDPGTHCVLGIDAPAPLCVPVCNPIAQDCPLGEGCYAISDTWRCWADGSRGLGAYGDPCTSDVACDPGLVCLDPAAVPGCAGWGCCTDVCDLGDPQCTGGPQGQVCTPWYAEGTAPAGYEDVGVCRAALMATTGADRERPTRPARPARTLAPAR